MKYISTNKLKQNKINFNEYQEFLFYILIGSISFIGDIYS
jgi:hypothetical protein